MFAFHNNSFINNSKRRKSRTTATLLLPKVQFLFLIELDSIKNILFSN